MTSRILPARLGTSPDDYARLKLRKGPVEPWEDGARTHGGKGSFEWWYFDSQLDDGSKLVIVFLPKDVPEFDKTIAPMISIHYDSADGKHFERIVRLPANTFSMGKDRCDVRAGRNTFQGDLNTYRIHVELEDVTADVTLNGVSPAWRPETGHIFYGDGAQDYFAWLVAVPQGTVEADLTIEGSHYQLTGSGYHDHNWGTVALLNVISNWYWARGRIGDYTAVSCAVTCAKKYGYRQFPLLMLARAGKIVAEDPACVRFDASDVQIDPETRKPFANVTSYTYAKDDDRYVVAFKCKQTILTMKLIEQAKGIKRVLGRMVGFDGAYHRFVGDVQLDHYQNDRLVETVNDQGLWEMNYLSKTRKEDLGVRS